MWGLFILYSTLYSFLIIQDDGGDMSFRDQKKYLETLKRYERNFTREEAEDYKMFVKMQKDEEDFDSISLRRLKEMHDKYNVPVDPQKYNHFFKKKEER